MPLSMDELKEMDTLLGASEAQGLAVAELRRRFPNLSLTCCDATDVLEKPFRVYERFEIHLLDNSGHCARIISDPVHATGIVLAQRSAAS